MLSFLGCLCVCAPSKADGGRPVDVPAAAKAGNGPSSAARSPVRKSPHRQSGGKSTHYSNNSAGGATGAIGAATAAASLASTRPAATHPRTAPPQPPVPAPRAYSSALHGTHIYPYTRRHPHLPLRRDPGGPHPAPSRRDGGAGGGAIHLVPAAAAAAAAVPPHDVCGSGSAPAPSIGAAAAAPRLVAMQCRSGDVLLASKPGVPSVHVYADTEDAAGDRGAEVAMAADAGAGAGAVVVAAEEAPASAEGSKIRTGLAQADFPSRPFDSRWHLVQSAMPPPQPPPPPSPSLPSPLAQSQPAAAAADTRAVQPVRPSRLLIELQQPPHGQAAVIVPPPSESPQPQHSRPNARPHVFPPPAHGVLHDTTCFPQQPHLADLPPHLAMSAPLLTAAAAATPRRAARRLECDSPYVPPQLPSPPSELHSPNQVAVRDIAAAAGAGVTAIQGGGGGAAAADHDAAADDLDDCFVDFALALEVANRTAAWVAVTSSAFLTDTLGSTIHDGATVSVLGTDGSTSRRETLKHRQDKMQAAGEDEMGYRAAMAAALTTGPSSDAFSPQRHRGSDGGGNGRPALPASPAAAPPPADHFQSLTLSAASQRPNQLQRAVTERFLRSASNRRIRLAAAAGGGGVGSGGGSAGSAGRGGGGAASTSGFLAQGMMLSAALRLSEGHRAAQQPRVALANRQRVQQQLHYHHQHQHSRPRGRAKTSLGLSAALPLSSSAAAAAAAAARATEVARCFAAAAAAAARGRAGANTDANTDPSEPGSRRPPPPQQQQQQ